MSKVEIDAADCEFAAGLLDVIAGQWQESAEYYRRAASGGQETESYKTKREHSEAAAKQIQGVVDRLNIARKTAR